MTFDPLFTFWPVILTATGLSAVFVFMEWRRAFRFRLLRCLAQLLMVWALTALVLRPAVPKNRAENDTILLTPHFNAAQADSLKQLYPHAQLRQIAGTDADRAVSTWSEHEIANTRTGFAYVLGDGLPPTVLDGIPEARYAFLPGHIPNGITGLRFSRRTVVHQTITLSGTLRNTYNGTRMILEGPGGAEDSTQLKTTAEAASFALTFTPRQAGRFMYRFVVKNKAGQTVDHIPMPIEVRGEKKLNILILQEFPTAEVRYLKNFLADHGHRLNLRYHLSRNIFRYESANTGPKKVTRLDEKLLNDTDLVILDSDALKNLPTTDRQQLEASLAQGLGIILFFNDAPGTNAALQSLHIPKFAALKQDTVQITLLGQSVQLRTLSHYMPAQDGFQPVLQAGNRSLAGYTFSGFGKTGVQLLTETYRFVTEGKPNLYAALWGPLIEQTARTRQQPTRIRVITPEPIYPDEPIDIEILTAGIKPTLLADSVPIALTEDVVLDDRWLGRVWFGEKGWHTLAVAEDSTQSGLYIHEPEHWQAARISYQHQLNRLRNGPRDAIAVQTTKPEPLSPWIFFGLFLAASGFLWLAPKL